jgi:hypothetical protein
LGQYNFFSLYLILGHVLSQDSSFKIFSSSGPMAAIFRTLDYFQDQYQSRWTVQMCFNSSSISIIHNTRQIISLLQYLVSAFINPIRLRQDSRNCFEHCIRDFFISSSNDLWDPCMVGFSGDRNFYQRSTDGVSIALVLWDRW